jgi:hypothetical protein
LRVPVKLTQRAIEPAKPFDVFKPGNLPNKFYRLVRLCCNDIIEMKDLLGGRPGAIAKKLKFRNAADYKRAYNLIKKHGKVLVEEGDWRPLEREVYARVPLYETYPSFRAVLKEVGDPRGRIGALEEGAMNSISGLDTVVRVQGSSPKPSDSPAATPAPGTSMPDPVPSTTTERPVSQFSKAAQRHL